MASTFSTDPSYGFVFAWAAAAAAAKAGILKVNLKEGEEKNNIFIFQSTSTET